MMMVPEAWENQTDMDPSVREFYEFHSNLMEPWDGPAALVFTDGSLVGATLDRNGLRPGRYVITSDGLIILASEIGVLDVDPSTVVRKGRLRPGSMLLADTVEGRLIEDHELKQQLAHQEPWGEWVREQRIELEKLPEREHIVTRLPPLRVASAPSDIPRRRCGFCSLPWGSTVLSLSGLWAPTLPLPPSLTGHGCSSTTSPNSSLR